MTELDKFKEWLHEPAFPLSTTSRAVDNGSYIETRVDYSDERCTKGITRLEYYLLAPNSRELQQVLILLAGVYGVLTGEVVTNEDLRKIFLNKKEGI